MNEILIKAALLALSSFFAFCFITSLYAAISTSPFMGTPKRIVRSALNAVKLRRGERFYDLGCGNGPAVVIAAKEFQANAIGFELSYNHYVIAKLRAFFSAPLAKIIWKNFYSINLSDADVIFCFLTPRAYPKLEHKFNNELKKGTRIVTYSSPLPTWKPDSTLPDKKFGTLFFYSKK